MYLAYKAIKKRRDAKQQEEAAQAAPQQPHVQDGASVPAAAEDGVSAEKQVVSTSQPPSKAPDKMCLHQEQAKENGSPPPELDAQGKCLVCKHEAHSRRVYRWKLIVSLLAPFFLASLDMTVVATALSFIASYFNKYNQLNWIVTAYTLTSTVFIPVYGQLADIFGRHSMLQVSMIFMAIGSTLAAAAQDWPMLLLGRALQGASAAGIQVLVGIILADKVSLKENAKNNSIFSLVSGISYSIGPVIGGYLTDSNWRYCFVISIPIAVFASLIIFFVLRKELLPGTFGQTERRTFKTFFQSLRSIDYGGWVLFLFGVGLIILATAWGGATYPWHSTHVLAPLVIGCVLFLLFFPYEYLLEDGNAISRRFPHQIPMIPFNLLAHLDVLRLAAVQFATGAALFSIFYFVGIYFTLVEGYSASRAGVSLVYYLPGLGAGVYIAMFLCNVWPCQTYYPLFFGTVIEFVGFCLITWAVTTRNAALVDGMMALAGLGTGLRFMPVNLHAVGMWPDKIANIISIMRFCLPFGGTIALTMMGSVFNNEMAGAFAAAGVKGGNFNLHNKHANKLLGNLPPAERHHLQEVGKNAVKWAFVSILPVLGLAVISALFMGNVWIKTKKIGNKDADVADAEKLGAEHVHKAGETSSESMALHSSYLITVLRGKVHHERVPSNITDHK